MVIGVGNVSSAKESNGKVINMKYDEVIKFLRKNAFEIVREARINKNQDAINLCNDYDIYLDKQDSKSFQQLHDSIENWIKLKTEKTNKTIEKFCKEYGTYGHKENLFIEKLRDCNFNDNQIASIIDIINSTCLECFDNEKGCQCWNDD